MVRQPDATMQPTPQDDQLMSKHRVLGFEPQLRLEWRGQDGQNEPEQPDHSTSLGDSITASTRMRFSVHTAGRQCIPLNLLGVLVLLGSPIKSGTSLILARRAHVAMYRNRSPIVSMSYEHAR